MHPIHRHTRSAAALFFSAAFAGLLAGPTGCAQGSAPYASSHSTRSHENGPAAQTTAGRIRIHERYRRDQDEASLRRNPSDAYANEQADAEDRRRAATVNPWTDTDQDPRSTFALDVDTASFAHARQALSQNLLPAAETVRTEEFVNAFRYEDPINPRQPFTLNTELAPTPFARNAYLLRINLRARPVADEDRKPANLTFVVDVSGSMQPDNRLPLVKQALADLVDRLNPDDQVAIVIFSSSAECILPMTPVSRRRAIERAIDSLAVAGATSIEDGLTLGYAIAGDNLDRACINRVILCTDGEANVGDTSPNGILAAVAREKARGISLSTVGFGLRDYNDRMLETLADKGNGNAAHVDSREEADRVFGDNLTAMLQTVAKDAKIQVEFNADRVAEYRLIGYENRALRREDFNNDNVDAGEIGAGHDVTALYELSLVGDGSGQVDPLRYGGGEKPANSVGAAEIAFVKLRYKQPDEDNSRLIERPVRKSELRDSASENLRFAAAVAAFADSLRGGSHLGKFDLGQVAALARNARGKDADGYRAEFIKLVETAQRLKGDEKAQAVAVIAD